MKHFYVAFAMLAMSLFASAEAYRSVAVNLTDGSKVEINLTDEFSASFTDGEFVVTGVAADITVPRAQIKSFTFSTKQYTGVEEVATDGTEPVFSGNNMIFNNLPEGSVIAVYNMAGALLLSETASGTYTLDLSTISTSPVIVTVNKVAYKIATK